MQRVQTNLGNQILLYIENKYPLKTWSLFQECQVTFNIRKSVNIIHHLNKSDKNRYLKCIKAMD